MTGPGPFGGLTPRYVLRFALAVVLVSAAMHYLVTGRKEASLRRMLVGAALALAGLLLL